MYNNIQRYTTIYKDTVIYNACKGLAVGEPDEAGKKGGFYF